MFEPPNLSQQIRHIQIQVVQWEATQLLGLPFLSIMGLLCSWWVSWCLSESHLLSFSLLSGTSTVAGSGIPPTSNASSPQHFTFVCSAVPLANGVQFKVYTTVSFSSSGGTVNRYNNLTEERKATLIPLTPLSHSVTAPELFRE
jgi:hypothetical protein